MCRDRGFSLLELMAASACFLILCVVTLSTWRHYAAKMKRDITVYQLKNGLVYARNQAIENNMSVVYCGSSDLQHCDGNWQYAEIVKDKRSGLVLKSCVLDTHSMLINFHSNFGNNREIAFTPRGMTNGQQGHFSVCMPASILTKSSCRKLKIHFSGEVIS